jgi:carbon-monoxide dehydrogenase large subunit
MIERVIDSVAYELGLDSVDVRRNMIQPDEMPFATHFEGIVYDESNYPAALDKLLEKIDYRELREEQARRRLHRSRLAGDPPPMSRGADMHRQYG